MVRYDDLAMYYYYLACPLCRQDVDISQTDSFRLLPLNPENVSWFDEKPVFKDAKSWIKVGGLPITHRSEYPSQPGMNRSWALHTKCISLVSHLPPSKLYQLLDLVEPTILSRFTSIVSEHGAFYARPIYKRNPVEGPVASSVPVPALLHVKQMITSFWEAAYSLISYATPKKERIERAPLPAEVWDLVLKYDIGRLLFVMRTASEITESITPSCPRFTAHTLDLTSSRVQIHLITIGGRSYIKNLSNPVDNGGAHDVNIKCVSLCGKKYLAVKSDGIGVVDIAFEQQEVGQPNWVLQNSTHPFAKELSEIKDANFQSLRIVQDVYHSSPPLKEAFSDYHIVSEVSGHHSIQHGACAIFSRIINTTE